MNRGPRGFTLIELMIALLVSSLLVGMILAIFSRMSLAYRGQQQIAGVQQVLSAARAAIEADAKQAGFAMPQGFRIAAAPTVQWPVQIRDGAAGAGPDQVAFFYGDPSAQAMVTAAVPAAAWAASPTVTVDTTTGFAAGDLVTLTTVDTTTLGIVPATDANLARYTACVMQIAPGGVVNTTTLQFATSGLWGLSDSSQCTAPSVGTILYKFVARGYRIDRTNADRLAVGALQRSPTGGVFADEASNGWEDIAFGFTDIQTALQVFDRGVVMNTVDLGAQDSDLDVDPLRDWYSGALQATFTRGIPPPPATPIPVSLADAAPLQISISLVARTDRDVEGIATAQTPPLFDTANVSNLDNNTIGNHAPENLPVAGNAALGGSRIYRYITFKVDFRNMGVGK
jgi:prepilin-type N-terminal cleavage/methylation domain-containing protein